MKGPQGQPTIRSSMEEGGAYNIQNIQLQLKLQY